MSTRSRVFCCAGRLLLFTVAGTRLPLYKLSAMLYPAFFPLWASFARSFSLNLGLGIIHIFMMYYLTRFLM